MLLSDIPVSLSAQIDGRLNTMQAFDFNTPNTKYPLLLTPAPASEPDALEASGEVDPCFFRFSFASFLPKEADVDYKLRVDMQPLKVVFNENIVARICTTHSCFHCRRHDRASVLTKLYVYYTPQPVSSDRPSRTRRPRWWRTTWKMGYRAN